MVNDNDTLSLECCNEMKSKHIIDSTFCLPLDMMIRITKQGAENKHVQGLFSIWASILPFVAAQNPRNFGPAL